MTGQKSNFQWFSTARLATLSIGMGFVVILLWILSPAESDVNSSAQPMPVLKVSTLLVKPSVYTVKERIVGTTQPRWALDVISAVEGRVESLYENSEPGDHVTVNSLLASIDDAAYQAQLSAADAQIKQAQLDLARYQHEQTVVEQVSGANKLSAYGRFEPHIATAKATLIATKDARKQMERRLTETLFYPPFDAVILERNVVPGQWVNVGDKLFTLIASDSIDIYAELSAHQQQSLGILDSTTVIKLVDQNGDSWSAKLRYKVPSHSIQTRQSQLVFYIEEPYQETKSLLPNSMVTLIIEGQQISNVLSAPSTVLTPDGYVWVVENSRLIRAPITIREEVDDKVWFQFKQRPEQVRELVRYPLSTMLPGQEVKTVQLSSTDSEANGFTGSLL